MKRRIYTKKNLILMLRQWAIKYGKTPTKRLINSDKDMPSDMSYRVNFGSWGEALLSAGFMPTKFIPVGARKGKRNKKRKIVNASGYDKVFEPNHPIASKNGYVLLHRKIMYDNGLLKNIHDVVHHKNGKKRDNRIENLEIMSIGEHTSHHVKGKKINRKNSKLCIRRNCEKLTSSKYGLCKHHYKLYWKNSKKINELCFNKNPDLLELK